MVFDLRGRSAPLLVALALSGCVSAQAPYSLRAVMWEDQDRRPFRTAPAELYTPAQWDRIDHTLFRPLSELFLYERSSEAVNVNALDEVPSSSWFENRIGRYQLTPERLAQGACEATSEPVGPFTVTHAKPAGSSPGLVVRAADGQRYLFKVDFDLPERGTAADSIGTRIFWGAGYETPCNRVVILDTNDLVVSTEEGEGGRAPPTLADIDRTLSSAVRLPNGLLRGSLSRFLSGELLGGWQFSGRRADDPNDVIPHERRRDVRGMVVLSAWLNHIDTRAENNMDVWVESADGRGYVRHLVLDAGDSFGQVFPGSMALSQSFGLASYFDPQHVFENLFSFGIADRAYFGAERGPAGDVLGFYDVERFDPEEWHNGYPNPAFDRATERDRAWMARIISRYTEAHLREVVRTGRFSQPTTERELVRTLRGRQTRIFERYLTRLSPLSFPEVDDGRLCLRDLAVEAGFRPVRSRRYHASAWRGWPAQPHRAPSVERADTAACVTLPSAPSTRDDPSYWVIDVIAETLGHERTAPARVHLYQLSDHDYRVVGLERPSDAGPP